MEKHINCEIHARNKKKHENLTKLCFRQTYWATRCSVRCALSCSTVVSCNARRVIRCARNAIVSWKTQLNAHSAAAHTQAPETISWRRLSSSCKRWSNWHSATRRQRMQKMETTTILARYWRHSSSPSPNRMTMKWLCQLRWIRRPKSKTTFWLSCVSCSYIYVILFFRLWTKNDEISSAIPLPTLLDAAPPATPPVILAPLCPQPPGLFECRMTNCDEKLPICRLLNHIRCFHKLNLLEVRCCIIQNKICS